MISIHYICYEHLFLIGIVAQLIMIIENVTMYIESFITGALITLVHIVHKHTNT